MGVTKNGMFKRMLEKMMSQYKPTKSGQLKMTFDGTVVLKKVVGDEESYIGITNEEVVSYDPDFVMDFPVYLINRPYNQVKVGDIVLVKEGKEAMYGKIVKMTSTKLDVLCFDGLNVVLTKTRDMLTNGETICTVLNMFGNAFDNNSNGNMGQLMLLGALGDGEGSEGKLDLESLVMLSMFQNSNGNSNNGGGLFGNSNLTALLLLGNKEGGKSDMMEKIILMNMLQNGNFNLFNTPDTYVKTEPKKTSNHQEKGKKVETTEVVE